MVILIVEDQKDLRETISIILESHFRAQAIQAGTVAEAVSYLKTNSEIQLIISDFKLPDGNGGDIFKFLKETNSEIPTIICSSEDPSTYVEFKGKSLYSHVPKPFQVEALINEINNTLSRNQLPVTSPGDVDYCPIRLSTFLKVNILTCDTYIRLSEKKYVKLSNRGDPFGKDDYDRYTIKNVEYLYIRSEDLSAFLSKFANDIFALSHVKNLSTLSAFEVSQFTHETLHQVVSIFGFTPEAQALAKSCTDLAMRSIIFNPELNFFRERFNFTRKNYLSTHSVLLAQTACLLASLLGWTSETTQYKLAYAALMHDLTLEDDSIALTELSLRLASRSLLTGQAGHSGFGTHPADAVKLISKVQGLPADVEGIILVHHERPDGTGFPNQLKISEIGPLPTVFIVAHDLANYFWLNENDANAADFINTYAKDYSGGLFKKILSLLKRLPDKPQKT